MRVKFNIVNGYYQIDNSSVRKEFSSRALIEQLTNASKIIVDWYNSDEDQSTEAAVEFGRRLREECGMSFCTDSDCINEYNTDFRTFNIEEIYG